MTYSIIARDAVTGQFGVAVQSHFLAVGASVPGARAGVGAVATQANLRTAFRTDGLRMLADGSAAEDALAACLAADPQPELRQIAMIDAQGKTAAHTGLGCWNAASHHAELGASAQANMVASRDIPAVMVAAYRSANGSFADRLLTALDAAEELGGDLRGRQSAAILIVAGDVPDDGDPVVLDLRVDNHPDPLVQLRETVGMAEAFVPMWRVIRGPACRGPFPPTPEESDEAIRVLGISQREYGEENLEPSFWRAVALWRASRQQEASATVARIARQNPGWAVLFDDVVARRSA